MIYVFLDTNIYLKGHDGRALIDPEQDLFPHLVRHAQNGRLRLVMPDAVKEKIEAHIRLAATAYRKTINELTPLRPSVSLTKLMAQLKGAYDPIAEAVQIQAQFRKFWADAACIELTAAQIDTEKLVRARALNIRDDIQAALTMQALENFRNTQMQTDDTLTVISADPAFREYAAAVCPDFCVYSGLRGLFDLWNRHNQEMLDLLNEGIHELELEPRIADELEGFDFTLTNGDTLLEYAGLEPEILKDPQTGHSDMKITGYEVIDDGCALINFEAKSVIRFIGVMIPEFLRDAAGNVCDVSYRTADLTKTVSLTGLTYLLGKFDADETLEFVDDVDDLELTEENGSMEIDLSDEGLEINYYDA